MRLILVMGISAAYALAWLFAILPVTKLLSPFPLNVTLGLNLVGGGLSMMGLMFLLSRGGELKKEDKEDAETKAEIERVHRGQLTQDAEPKPPQTPINKEVVNPPKLTPRNEESKIGVIITRRYRGSIAIQDLELIDERVEESKW